jgi:hypothetical protein
LIIATLTLQPLGDERKIYVPYQTAEAKKDHAALHRAVGGTEEVGDGPDFVRIPD